MFPVAQARLLTCALPCSTCCCADSLTPLSMLMTVTPCPSILHIGIGLNLVTSIMIHVLPLIAPCCGHWAHLGSLNRFSHNRSLPLLCLVLWLVLWLCVTRLVWFGSLRRGLCVLTSQLLCCAGWLNKRLLGVAPGYSTRLLWVFFLYGFSHSRRF